MATFNETLKASQDFVTKRGADVTTSGTVSDLANTDVSFFRLTAATTLESIVAHDDGKELILINANSVPMTLKNETGSTAANRILTGTGADVSIESGASMLFKYDGGSSRWRLVGGAGGSGEIQIVNYLISSGKEWNFESGQATGYVTYADAAGVAPVDGTGGSPNVTFAASSSAPQRGVYSGLFTKDAANRQGQGVSVDFTLDTQDVGKPFTFSFDTIASAAFTGLSGTESMRVYCYDVTNGALLPGYVDVSPGTSTTKGFFLATSSTSYRFILHVSGTGTSAWTVKVDDVTVGQQPMSLASTTTDWQTYTPTFNGLGTVTSIVARWRRVGDSIQICGTFTTGTVSGSGIAYMSLPNSYQINTTIVSSNRGFQLGTFSKLSSTTQNIWDAQQSGTLTYDSTAGAGNLLFAVQVDSGSYRSTTPNNIFNNTENHSFVSEMIPVNGLSSNIVSGDRAVEEFAYNTSTATTGNDTTSFGYGAAGQRFYSVTATGTRRVRFQTPIQPTDLLEVEIFDGVGWSPASEAGIITSGVQKLQVQNGVSTGIDIIAIVNATDVDVRIGQFPNANSTYGAGGAAWSTILSTILWRVRKVSGGALVGYPINQANIVYDPTALSDAQATLEGKKQYYNGTIYNGGNSPSVTVSGATITIQRGLFIPYKMQDGSWRLKFNVSFTSSTTTSIPGGQFNITFNGVTYKNVANFNQSVNAWTNAITNIVNYSYATPNTSNILVHFGTYNNFNQTDYECSGDVELDSKPTWAY